MGSAEVARLEVDQECEIYEMCSDLMLCITVSKKHVKMASEFPAVLLFCPSFSCLSVFTPATSTSIFLSIKFHHRVLVCPPTSCLAISAFRIDGLNIVDRPPSFWWSQLSIVPHCELSLKFWVGDSIPSINVFHDSNSMTQLIKTHKFLRENLRESWLKELNLRKISPKGVSDKGRQIKTLLSW